MARIFNRQERLRPSQLVTVAERRFEDARALCETGKNAHANGAQYLCGFVVEMLLKAQLMRRYPAVVAKRQHETMSHTEREIWSLMYRSHDLDEMLGRLREVERAIEKHGRRTGRPYLQYLREICSTWTIHARYSPPHDRHERSQADARSRSRAQGGAEMSERGLPASLRKLVKTVKAELNAEVEVERVESGDSWPDRFRLAVVSPKFRAMKPLQRQDRLWEIVNRVLNPEEAFNISVIFAFSPGELEPTSKSRK